MRSVLMVELPQKGQKSRLGQLESHREGRTV